MATIKEPQIGQWWKPFGDLHVSLIYGISTFAFDPRKSSIKADEKQRKTQRAINLYYLFNNPNTELYNKVYGLVQNLL